MMSNGFGYGAFLAFVGTLSINTNQVQAQPILSGTTFKVACEKDSDTGAQDTSKCIGGMDGCYDVKLATIEHMRANVRKKIELYNRGVDQSLNDDIETARQTPFPIPCEPGAPCAGQFVHIDGNGVGVWGGAGPNAPGSRENSYKGFLYQKSLECALKRAEAKVVKGDLTIALSCEEAAKDVSALNTATTNSSQAFFAGLENSANEFYTNFCTQEDNNKRTLSSTQKLTKVTNMCTSAGDLGNNFDSEIERHRMSACRLETAKRNTQAAGSHVMMCHLFADAEETFENLVVTGGDDSPFNKHIIQNVVNPARSDGRRYAKRKCRRRGCSRGKAKRYALRKVRPSYRNRYPGQVQVFADRHFNTQTCGEGARVTSAGLEAKGPDGITHTVPKPSEGPTIGSGQQAATGNTTGEYSRFAGGSR